jgi:antitoxin (DNA-binding transcriptional repressor) of toxin-antitoxin stability system
MMEKRLSATELAKNLSSVLSRVQYRGERFVVERNGEPVATIGPVEPSMGMTVRELFDLLGRIDRPDDQFADDLEAVQTEQGTAETPPWPS